MPDFQTYRHRRGSAAERDFTADDIEPLEGWLTIQQVADLFGITKQAVGKAVLRARIPLFGVEDLRYIGDDRPFYLIRETAVQAELERRMAAQREAADRG